MDIIIQDNGIITPFNIQSSRETGFTLLAQTRDATEEKEAADGDIDFGTWLGMNEFNLHGVIRFFNLNERNTIERTLMGQLNDCRTSKRVFYEHSPVKYTLVRLTNKPDITKFPRHMEVRAQFKADPFWHSTEEHSSTGSGTIINAGTFETAMTIEISGSATNPSLMIGDNTLAYTGNIPAGQKLIISIVEDGVGTVKLNGVNAIGDYNKAFPMLQPGNTSVTAGSNVIVKWRDRWN